MAGGPQSPYQVWDPNVDPRDFPNQYRPDQPQITSDKTVVTGINGGAAQPTVDPSTRPYVVPGTPDPYPIKPYTPPAGNGLNMMEPGALEKFYADNAGFFSAPTQTSMFAPQALDSLSTPSMGETVAGQAINKYGVGGPGIAPANLDPYYSRAEARLTSSMNDQLAARGAYGSSVGLGMIGQSLADLNAQRAQQEADYDLKRDASSREWMNALLNAAQTGDTSKLSRILAGLKIAGESDSQALQRILGGASVAGGSQGAQRGRGQDFFNNELDAGRVLSDTAGGTYNNIFNMDSALLDAINALNIGQGSAGVTESGRAGGQSTADFDRLIDAFTAAGQAGKDLHF